MDCPATSVKEFAGLVSARSEVLDMGTAAETCGAAGSEEMCLSESVGGDDGDSEETGGADSLAGGRAGASRAGKQRASFGPGVVETAKAAKREAVGQAMRMRCGRTSLAEWLKARAGWQAWDKAWGASLASVARPLQTAPRPDGLEGIGEQ
ncbi:hypothetical protein MY4038_007769 [Beauveria bassiana]